MNEYASTQCIRYHQFNFMVANFDAKAAAVDQWIKDTLDNLQQVASEADESTANGLSQKIAAHKRYTGQVERYSAIMRDLEVRACVSVCVRALVGCRRRW